jgi:hypothetical protein
MVAFGQNLPQWKVVHSVGAKQSSQQIPPTVLFTPSSVGTYRVSAYITAVAPEDWTLALSWSDLNGAANNFTLSTGFNSDNWAYLTPITFSIKPGQPFTYSTSGSGSYTFAFTIEQLK